MRPILSLLALLVALTATAAEPKKGKPAPHPSLAPVEDVAKLPRVLLIGDSISIGYTVPVRKLLEGKANVHRIPTNGGPTSKGIAINDINACVTPEFGTLQKPKDVHFTEEGSAFLAKRLAAEIETALPKPKE